MAVANQKKRLLLTTFTAICIVISGLRYHQDGDVPLLRMIVGEPSLKETKTAHKRRLPEQCECTCQTAESDANAEEDSRKLIPYVAPGPSKVQELVPMKTLKKSISLSEQEGLVYLDHTSLSHYFQCQQWSKAPLEDKLKQKQCHKRRFLKKGPITALVSFHGSGNTWVRYLLEQATGIFSGSIYCDPVLKKIFPGESVASGNVVVVKTHHSDTRELPKDVQLEMDKKKYDRAIVLVRDPFDALVSEANRRWNNNRTVNSHVGLADETAFVSRLTITCTLAELLSFKASLYILPTNWCACQSA